MKNKRKERLLIFLQRSQMHLYKESSNKVDTWSFDPALINDLEIHDEDKFRLAIDGFVNQQKLNGGEAIVLLDNSVYFTQKITQSPEKKTTDKTSETLEIEGDTPGLIEKVNFEEEEKLKFMHSMPFSNVFATILTVGKEKVIFSLNRDFYEPFIKEFTDRKYEVSYIYPILIVNELFGKEGFSSATAESFIQSADKYKVYNFLQAPLKKEIGPTPSSTIMPDNSERKRLYLLIGAFCFLLLLLGGVILWSRSRDAVPVVTPPVQDIPTTPAVAENTPLPETSPVIATSSADDVITPVVSTESAQFSNLRVALRNATGSVERGEAVEQRLIELGFTATSITSLSQQSADSTVIIVKPSVSNEIRQLLQTELINFGYASTFQESDEVIDDISINLSSQ